MSRKLAGEAIGTALLLYLVVGSGIVVDRSGADPVVLLFLHAAAVGLGLAALIAVLAPVSGAHLNPAVTLAFVLRRSVDRTVAMGYVAAQVGGGLVGTLLAHVSFAYPAISLSDRPRTGIGLWVSEAIVTAGLVAVIVLLAERRQHAWIPGAVGAWVAAAIFASSSTGFANPAVTIARVATDTYTGIAPGSVTGFLVAQTVGTVGSVAWIGWTFTTRGARTT